jgi:outer membrane protein assembly factor BamB
LFRGSAFTSDGGLLTAVRLDNGAVRWQTHHTYEDLGDVALGEPSLVQGHIETPWFLARYGGIVSSERKTGEFSQSQTGRERLGHVAIRHGHQASLEASFIPNLWVATLEYGAQYPGYVDSGSSGGPAPYSDPIFVGTHHIWVGVHGALDRFDPGTCIPAPHQVQVCMPIATAPLAGNIAGLAEGPDDSFVATTDTGVVQVFDGRHGNELWRATPGNPLAAPLVAGGVIVVGDAAGEVHAYSATGCGAATCAPLWEGDAGAAISTAPAFSDGTVFVGTADGSVVGFAAAGCGAAVCTPVSIGHSKHASVVTGGPVVADGFVVIGTADGVLTAFRTH